MCASFFTRVRPRGGVGWWQSSVRIRRHRISMWRSASMPLLVMVLHLTSGFYLPGAAVQHVATSRPPHPFRVPPVICEVQISDKDDAEHMAAAARAEALDHMRHRRLREASVALQGLARMRTLDSEVCHAAFEAFVENRHPSTGSWLRSRHSSRRPTRHRHCGRVPRRFSRFRAPSRAFTWLH